MMMAPFGGPMMMPMMAPPIGMPSMGMVGPGMIGVNTQQQHEQISAMQAKFTVKSSLEDKCEKHPGLVVIFSDENLGVKVCEMCYRELDD